VGGGATQSAAKRHPKSGGRGRTPVSARTKRSGQTARDTIPRSGIRVAYHDEVYSGALPVRAGEPGRRPPETEGNRLWLLKQILIGARASPERDLMGAAHPSCAARAFALMRGPGERWFADAIRKLEEVWHRFFPEERGQFVVEPVGKTPEAGFDLFLQRDGMRLSADLLGSGELEILVLTGWFLLNDHSGGIIFIDEPEQHLHVQWHRAVLPSLRELQPRSQFIVATHSPEILDSVRSYERFLLLPKGDPRQAVGRRERSEGQA